jgi:phosphoribosylglycinamide formyltransferase-1
MNIVVFAYNFPHKKTQDFLFRLFVERANVVAVLAADPVELNIPSPTVRVKPRFGALVHPRAICERFGWHYEVIEHRGEACAAAMRKVGCDVGVVAGARILKEPVISAARIGIVNFHPGWIPEVRGLDALQWAIAEDKRIGVTAHLIDERVDAGRIVQQREIKLFPDDTLLDVSIRLHETQMEMLPDVLQLLGSKPRDSFPLVGKSPLHRKMPPELEAQIAEKLKERLKTKKV